jgi:hypothetical protein
VPPPRTFARVLAAEALAVRREGGSDAGAKELLAFWAAVLRGVDDEPAAATLERFRRVPAPPAAAPSRRVVQQLADELAELQARS